MGGRASKGGKEEDQVVAKTHFEYIRDGDARNEAGDLVGAVQDYTLALGRNPRYFVSLHRRGRTHRQLGNIDEALCDLNACIDLRDDYGPAYLERALVHESCGRPEMVDADRAMAARLGALGVPTKKKTPYDVKESTTLTAVTATCGDDNGDDKHKDGIGERDGDEDDDKEFRTDVYEEYERRWVHEKQRARTMHAVLHGSGGRGPSRDTLSGGLMYERRASPKRSKKKK
eukprot:PhM_4_TR16382/c0_g1_i1/m.32418